MSSKPNKNYAYVNKSRNQRRALLRQLKNKPCFDCGNCYPYYVMDFDHVRGEKKLTLSNAAIQTVSLKRLLDEVDKCDVVCANCHRERTQQRFYS